jgi:uncharacterized protein involved in response to NO
MSAPEPQPNAPRCPRHAARPKATAAAPTRRITPEELFREPFRLLFPAAVLAGLAGLLVWPMVLLGWMTDYPGERHARLMVEGFFGGFILGFLGTSVPRLLEVRPFNARETLLTLGLLLASVAAHTFGALTWGDGLFLAAVVWSVGSLLRRWPQRQDLPPPGFVMMPLAFVSLLAALAIRHAVPMSESPTAELLSRLLGYHGFVLLCVLGAGGFLLPRFLGLGVREKFPTRRTPDAAWKRSAAISALTGLIVLGSYGLDATQRPQAGSAVRAVAVTFHFVRLMPLGRLKFTWAGVQWLLVTGLALIPIGILAAGWLAGWRVALAHLELAGGFGLITVGVATRVVFGHSGARERLDRFHGWLTFAAGLMLLGMATRISGDFLPHIMVSHYIYGALGWTLGLGIWAWVAFPLLLRPDPEA